MGLPSTVTFARIIQDLDRYPNAIDGLLYNELQARFDENPEALRVAVNAILTALADTTVGDNGAKQIGIYPYSDLVSTDVYNMIVEIYDKVLLNTAKVSFPEAPIDGKGYVRKDGAWALETSNSPLNDLSDVTITAVTNDEVLQFTGTVWENQTLAEAGILESEAINLKVGDGFSIIGESGIPTIADFYFRKYGDNEVLAHMYTGNFGDDFAIDVHEVGGAGVATLDMRYDGTFTWNGDDIYHESNIHPFDFNKTGWDEDTYSLPAISFVDGTRTFTLTPSGTARYYLDGTRVDFTVAKSVVISDVEGYHFIYFDNTTATLVESTTEWTFDNTKVFCAIVYWDATNNKSIIVGDELHDWTFAQSLHEYLHHTRGTSFDRGLALTELTTTTIKIDTGDIHDENIEHTIGTSIGSTQPLNPLEAPIIYLDGAGANIRSVVASTDLCYLNTQPQVNTWSGSAWQLENVSNNQYFAYWVIATVDIDEPIMLIPGQSSGEALLVNARNNNELADMNFIPYGIQEYVVLYRIIMRAGTGTYTIEEVEDYRQNNASGGSVLNINHTHTFADITDVDITTPSDEDALFYESASGLWKNESLVGKVSIDGLSDVTITSVANDEILQYTGSGWENQTLAEAGISAVGHAHTASEISDFDTEVANNSAVTANTAKVTNATHTGEVTGSTTLTIADNIVDEANLKLDTAPTNGYVLTADDTQSGGMKWASAGGGGASVLDDLTDVTITSVANDEVLQYTGTGWENQTLAEAGISAVGHAHVYTDVTNFQTGVSANTDVVASKAVTDQITITGTHGIQETFTFDAGGGDVVIAGDGYLDIRAKSSSPIQMGNGTNTQNLYLDHTEFSVEVPIKIYSGGTKGVANYESTGNFMELGGQNENAKIMSQAQPVWDSGSVVETLAIVAPITNKTASFTLALAEAYEYLTCNSTSTITITVPPNSSVAFEIGTEIAFEKVGTGAVTLAEGSGVTIRSKGSNKSIDGQYATCAIKKVATDTWTLAGSLTT